MELNIQDGLHEKNMFVCKLFSSTPSWAILAAITKYRRLGGL